MSGAPMNLDRLHALLDAYGADSQRWPEHERDAALALLEQSAAAQTARQHAAALDAALDDAPLAPPSPMLADRILATAPTAANKAANVTVLRPAARKHSPIRYLAAAVPLAAAAVLSLWLVSAPQPNAPGPEATASLSDDMLAELGSYGTPGDALLTVTEVDVIDDDPWTDCSDGGLGCLDFEAIQFDSLSENSSGRLTS